MVGWRAFFFLWYKMCLRDQGNVCYSTKPSINMPSKVLNLSLWKQEEVVFSWTILPQRDAQWKPFSPVMVSFRWMIIVFPQTFFFTGPGKAKQREIRSERRKTQRGSTELKRQDKRPTKDASAWTGDDRAGIPGSDSRAPLNWAFTSNPMARLQKGWTLTWDAHVRHPSRGGRRSKERGPETWVQQRGAARGEAPVPHVNTMGDCLLMTQCLERETEDNDALWLLNGLFCLTFPCKATRHLLSRMKVNEPQQKQELIKYASGQPSDSVKGKKKKI